MLRNVVAGDEYPKKQKTKNKHTHTHKRGALMSNNILENYKDKSFWCAWKAIISKTVYATTKGKK